MNQLRLAASNEKCVSHFLLTGDAMRLFLFLKGNAARKKVQNIFLFVEEVIFRFELFNYLGILSPPPLSFRSPEPGLPGSKQ